MQEAFVLFLIHSLEETHCKRGCETNQGRTAQRGTSLPHPPAVVYRDQWQLPGHGSSIEGTRLRPHGTQLMPQRKKGDKQALQHNKENTHTRRSQA